MMAKHEFSASEDASNNDLDWSDCYGIAWDRNSLGNYDKSQLSQLCRYGDLDIGLSLTEQKGINSSSSVVDSESGYCDSLSISTDKGIAQGAFTKAPTDDLCGETVSPRSEDTDDLSDGELELSLLLEDMPFLVGIKDQNRNSYFLPKSISTDDGGNTNSQIISSKGTVRGVKNRVRSSVKRFLEQKPQAILADEDKSPESDVIIYTTSLRSIRQTHDNCCYVKKILHNNKIKTDERDIFLHEHYRNELLLRLNGDVTDLPVVFVKGELLGGKEEVDRLNETGSLKDLATTLQRIESPIPCSRCGGFRFVNCQRCSGSGRSRRMRISREINSLRCTTCTKGLAPCPDCNSCLVKETDLGVF